MKIKLPMKTNATRCNYYFQPWKYNIGRNANSDFLL